MNITFKNILVFAAIACTMACQKKDNTPADPTKVSVLFTSLTSGQVFHSGDTIPLSADVSYTAEMLGIGVQVIDSATDSVLFEDDHDIHTDHFRFESEWVDDLPYSATLQVKILVFMANNTSVPAERVINISSKP